MHSLFRQYFLRYAAIRLVRRFFGLLIFLLPIHLAAQTSTGHQMANLLHQHTAKGLQEKVYVHASKDVLQAGELLWFKVYCLNATSHQPLNLSKVAYLEILDGDNHAVAQAKIGMQHGEGSGAFYIPAHLASGNYKLRAYTNWMKNADPGFYFEKKLTILNINHMATGRDSIAPGMDIQFFPEGGHLVSGLRSRLAFKGVDEHGQPLQFTGMILSGEDTLINFAPNHAGMGQLDFRPEAGKNYTARIHAGNRDTTIALPEVNAQGMVMRVTRTGQQVQVDVEAAGMASQNVYLLAHSRSSVKINQQATLSNGLARFSFNETELGEGISHLTLFNQAGQPLSERLLFRRPERTLSLNLGTDKSNYGLRDKISLSLERGMADDLDTTGISLSVYKIDSLQAAPATSILHYLYLNSELRGYVHDPAFYFEPGPEAARAADDLMLTQGWRRFNWKNLIAGQDEEYPFPPELRGHFITGKVLEKETNQPVGGIPVFLSAPAAITQFYPAHSNPRGLLRFEMNNFFGGSVVIAQVGALVPDSQYQVVLDDPFSKSFSAIKIPEFQAPVKNPETLLKDAMSVQVQNSFHAQRMNALSYPAFTDTASFYQDATLSYQLDQYTRFRTVEEVLREYVAYVNVRRRSGQVELPMIDISATGYLPGQPLMLLDGVRIYDNNKFFELDPDKLKSIDVIPRRYIFGSFLFNGIINWKSRTPSLTDYHLAGNALVQEYEGLLPERTFYAPVYDSAEKMASRLPDYRQLLLWNPAVQLTGSHKVSLDFYTSDIPGKYIIVAEGLSQKGVAGSALLEIEAGGQ